MQYQETLPLDDKEVVLTFDDGPMPPYTNRVLETLAHECVKANYFIVGRMARGYPDLLRRIHAEGHVIGTHSENHPLAFERCRLAPCKRKSIRVLLRPATRCATPDAVAPFFRIPGLLRADNVEKLPSLARHDDLERGRRRRRLEARHRGEVVSRSIARLDARGKGILLLHDIQPATAPGRSRPAARAQGRGYKIVQVAPASAPLVASATRQPSTLACNGRHHAHPGADSNSRPRATAATPPQPHREITPPVPTRPARSAPARPSPAPVIARTPPLLRPADLLKPAPCRRAGA